MSLMKTLDPKKIVLWSLIFFIIYMMALLRPIHQDDGWYASFALRYLDLWGMVKNASYFSFADSNGGHDGPLGITFSSLQSVFFALFGFSIETSRLFNAVVIFGLVFTFHKITQKELPKFSWWITVALIIHPVFYYHFYNRPEIVAALLVLISIYILLYHSTKASYLFVAYFIWAFVLDTHPIAIFSLIGVGLWHWSKNANQTKIILFAGLSGLFAKIIINQLANGNIGLFAGFIGQVPINFGDHYVPLFQSDFSDYLRIAKDRFDSIKSFLVFSGIFILMPVVLLGKQRLKFLKHPLVLNYFAFLILSTFGTEASSNGFALYSIINLMLLYVVALRQCDWIVARKFGWLIFLPLLLSSLRSTGITLFNYKNHHSSLQSSFSQFTNCMVPNAKYLMRPTFVFNNHDKNIKSDYTFGIMNVMRERNIGFMDAIMYKQYDYIVLDERNLKEEFLLDVRSTSNYSNPAYIAYQNIGFRKQEFEDWIAAGQLKPVCDFNEISHGHSVLYKVRK
jgi:hypothetical protein